MGYRLYYLLVLIFFGNVNSSDFGTTGLLDIPTSRMMEDGDLKVNYNSQKIANIVNLTYQATPWLETTFRYTIFNADNPIRNSANIDGLNDRSYGLKLKLLKERKYIPSVSLGIRDILGTGAWSSEYLVATKGYNNFDFTAGLGWGRLAERAAFNNPFNSGSEGKPGGKYGGKIRVSSFFKGEKIGVFGGFSYYEPKYKLKFIAEYNSDSYDREIAYNTIPESSPISYGIEWQGLENFNLGLSYQQDNQIAFSFSSKINTKYLAAKKASNKFYASSEERSLSKAPEHLNIDSWYDRLLYDMERSDLLLRRAELSNQYTHVTLEMSNLSYILTADAINKTLALADVHLPRTITNVDIVLNENDFKVATVSFSRQSGKVFSQPSLASNNISILMSREMKNPTFNTTYLTPKLDINADLAARFQFFDPNKPARYQVYLDINSQLLLPKGWVVRSSVAIDIDHNFDTRRPSNSRMRNVRSGINKYLVQGASGIDSLYLEKRNNINENLYYRFYFGILESMYSGVGAEILYQPFKSRLAYGATYNHVRQRGYERNFDLREYETSTGFMSLYYASLFYNYDFAIHAGKYLAKDTGFTFEVRRTFDNGFAVGAFATLTNVSAEEFGEGSFDKGLYFKFPFSSFTKLNTKRSFSTIIRSIQRDGGQRLDDFSGNLWFENRNIRYDSLENNKNRMKSK